MKIIYNDPTGLTPSIQRSAKLTRETRTFFFIETACARYRVVKATGEVQSIRDKKTIKNLVFEA